MANDVQPVLKKRILIVDDDITNIRLLADVLEDEYVISPALNGKQALVIASSTKKPDLILLDVVMPGMDGYDVCRFLKKNPETAAIPVIFITAIQEVVDEAKGLECGAIDFVRKPFSPPSIRARVRNHIALKVAREMLESQNEELRKYNQLREDVERITRHDLRTPLSTIIGVPQLMLNDSPTPKQARQLRRIEAAGYRMLHMLNLSLDLFKMEIGAYVLAPACIDLIPLLNNIIEEMSSLCRSYRVTLKLHLNGVALASQNEKFLVNGEELLCYSLLTNLIKNAIEASPEEGIVTISLDDHENKCIMIHNQGAVPEDVRATFFEKYTTSGKDKGTGLGTYSAKLITQTLGGAISMQTSQGAGTTITVLLPAVCPATTPCS